MASKFAMIEFQSTLLMRGATVADVVQAAANASFQSTLLMRGATRSRVYTRGGRAYFNPRSSCEERRECLQLQIQMEDFNPRSSCEERLNMLGKRGLQTLFQSTLLMRGATLL